MKNLLIIALLLGNLQIFSQTLSLDTGETYAVVVGISDYQDPQIPDLRFADKDAEAFANFLRSPAGGSLDEDHLKVLINEQATAGQVAAELYWLMEVSGKNDKVIIYFSGHGDAESKFKHQPGFLLCWDAPARVYMAGGVIDLRMLQDVISAISVDNQSNVLVVTDACRSGKLSGSQQNGPQIANNNLAKQYANEIKILSCQPDEYSIEGEQWGDGRGAFSYHLLDGLYGMADGNGDLNVNLKEIGRYLEDNVTEQVAPEKQNPMILGDKAEKLTDVFPEIVNQLKEGRRGQMQLFKPTETRGIEEDVLASVDSITQKIYSAFKRALKEKQFLEPVDACADAYYEILIKEPKLEKLHSSMRRNYAAALQDDAQQVMNIMLKSGLTERILKNASYADLYYNYPKYLERAAELLGEAHYMYNILQARKYFFEGMIRKKRIDKRAAFRNALRLQPDMAHAMVYLIQNFEAEQRDSAEFYFEKAATLIPSWVEPYVSMSNYYKYRLKKPAKEEEMLNLAGQLDSTSVLVWCLKGSFYGEQKKYKLAEKWGLKTVEAAGEDICFPCAYNNLGTVYRDIRRYEEAEEQFKKAIELDSTFILAYNNLGSVYQNTRRYKEAEEQFKKSVELDSTYTLAYINLGIIYTNTRRYAEAEEQFKKVIGLKSTNIIVNNGLGLLYKETRRYKEAEEQFKKAIELDSTFIFAYNNLGNVYRNTRCYEEAEKQFKKAIGLDSTYSFAYNNLGNVYRNTRRYKEAEEQFKKAIELDSTNWQFYANLGILYQNLLHWEASETMILKAIKIGPPIWELRAILGNAYTHIPSKMEVAKFELEKVIEMFPDYPATYIYLAQWFLKNDQPDKAWEYLEQGLEKGNGKGEVTLRDLQEIPDFAEMRQASKWNELMQKYFPDQHKK